MAHNLRKNRIFGRAVLLFMAIALADAIAQEVEMTPLRLESLPVVEVTTAVRVVLVGDPPRMILGARAKEGMALELFKVRGHKASLLTTIQPRLFVSLDFDLAADPEGRLSVAYENPLGATSEVRIQSLGIGEILNRPPFVPFVSEHRPRFVRGGNGNCHQ